jgi:hypothetical protein
MEVWCDSLRPNKGWQRWEFCCPALPGIILLKRKA